MIKRNWNKPIAVSLIQLLCLSIETLFFIALGYLISELFKKQWFLDFIYP